MKPQVIDFVRYKKLEEWSGLVYQVRRNMVKVLLEERVTLALSELRYKKFLFVPGIVAVDDFWRVTDQSSHVFGIQTIV